MDGNKVLDRYDASEWLNFTGVDKFPSETKMSDAARSVGRKPDHVYVFTDPDLNSY